MDSHNVQIGDRAAGLADFNRDLNQMIFFVKKSCDLNHSCLYTLNPLYGKNFAQAQHMYCLKLFLYSFIQSLSS